MSKNNNTSFIKDEVIAYFALKDFLSESKDDVLELINEYMKDNNYFLENFKFKPMSQNFNLCIAAHKNRVVFMITRKKVTQKWLKKLQSNSVSFARNEILAAEITERKAA